MRSIQIFALALVAFSLVACGGKEQKEEKEEVKIGTQTETKSADSNTVNVGLTGNDLMQYDKSEIRVKAGQEVTLTLRHIGQQDLLVMGHNFVLLKPGVSITEFSLKAAEAGQATDWIPEEGNDVIVHTKMIGGGESTSITFMAPEAGTYDFICSFPGHSAMMKGKFIVE
jgi:azurin